MGNGVSTTVYGVSEATSTFGTAAQHPPATPRSSQDSTSQRPPQGAVDMGDGSGTPVPPRHHPTAYTLPSRGGTSGLMQTHWATAGASSSQSSLSHSATAAYPVTSFRGRTSGTSQDSLEQQIASLAMNINFTDEP